VELDLNQLVGMSFEEACHFLKDNDYKTRIAVRDGVYRAMTQDYRLDRVNLSVRNDKVTAWRIG
jgi:thermostable 8-oxoguanine DNA glycosylase